MSLLVVIDTNVVVSAMLNFRSVPGEVLRRALMGDLIPVLREEIVEEYRNVLRREKFCFDSGTVEAVLEGLADVGLWVKEVPADVDMPDPDDRVFYEAAVAAREEGEAYLVTGNTRHFPTLPFVVTPRQMLDIVLEADHSGTEDVQGAS